MLQFDCFNATNRPLRITRTYLVQMSKIDIIIESEATMYALSANAQRTYRCCIVLDSRVIDYATKTYRR